MKIKTFFTAKNIGIALAALFFLGFLGSSPLVKANLSLNLPFWFPSEKIEMQYEDMPRACPGIRVWLSYDDSALLGWPFLFFREAPPRRPDCQPELQFNPVGAFLNFAIFLGIGGFIFKKN